MRRRGKQEGRNVDSAEVTRIAILLKLAKVHYVKEFELLRDRIKAA